MSNGGSQTAQNIASSAGSLPPGGGGSPAACGPKCNHDWDCKPIPRSPGKTTDEMIRKVGQKKDAGAAFEARAAGHNKANIKSGDDVSPDFECKKCHDRKEVDHITRDANGNITKVVQCKSDQSKAAGGTSNKGVIIKPKQLREDCKVIDSINACQKNSGVQARLEYKLQAGAAADQAEKFLQKMTPATSILKVP